MKTKNELWQISLKSITKPLFFFVMVVVLLSSCKKEDDMVINSISINPNEVTMYTGDSDSLKVLITPSDIVISEIIWKSSNEKVVQVENGVITALSFGKSDIIATVGSFSASCHITVLPHTYIAGYVINENNYSVATVWKDGVAISLTDGTKNSVANSVFEIEGDIYAGGYIDMDNNKGLCPIIWKNGKVDASLCNESTSGSINSITKANNIFYAVGCYGEWVDGEYYEFPAIWKDGIRMPLLETPGEASSLSVVGNDVYVGGYEKISKDLSSRIIWKNGTSEKIGEDGFLADVKALYVDAQNPSDVYLGGYIWKSGESFTTAYQCKNGEELFLTDGSTHAGVGSIIEYQGNIYAAGYIGNEYDILLSVVWKNGQVYKIMSDGDKEGHSSINSFLIVDSIEYACGTCNFEDESPTAVLWVNGIKTELAKNVKSEAKSLFIR